MSSENPWIARSTRLYAWLLRLYPARFGQQFGPAVRDAFARWVSDEMAADGHWGLLRVWGRVSWELIPTLIREHIEAFGDSTEHPYRHAFTKLLRLFFAGALPVAVFVAFLSTASYPNDVAVVVIWFALMAGGMIRARGRGWRCMRNGMLGAAIGVGLPMIYNFRSLQYARPSPLLVGPLLISASATLGLILAVYVRVWIEGISRSPKPT